jgi:hypothetical protein
MMSTASAFRNRGVIVAAAITFWFTHPASGQTADADFTFWRGEAIGWPDVIDKDSVKLGGPSAVTLDRRLPGFLAYADVGGRVRAFASASGTEPADATTHLIWRRTFRKGTAQDTARFTINRSFLDLKTTEEEFDESPFVSLSMNVSLIDPERVQIVTTFPDDFNVGGVEVRQAALPQFYHTATMYQFAPDELAEPAERTELFGSKVWDRAQAQEPGNAPVVDSRFTIAPNDARYELETFVGEINLDGIEDGALYTVQYSIYVSVVHDGGEFAAQAFLGDPLDVDSGFRFETTSIPVDEEPATSCQALTDTSRFRYDPQTITVTDRYTGLTWQRCPLGYTLNNNGTIDDVTDDECEAVDPEADWQTALQRSAAATLAGHTDWRLPNIKELDSIVELGCRLPAIDSAPFPDTPAEFFWSSTPDANAGNAARAIDFGLGYSSPLTKTSVAHARPVRTSDQPIEAPLPTLQLGRPPAVDEGDGAPTSLVFPVELERIATTDVTVDYETRDHTATAGADYTSTSGTLTIPAGSRRAEVAVPVVNDAVGEDYEALYLVLANASANVRLSVDENLGQINDDEPLVTIAPGSTSEATPQLSFAIALSTASATEVSVDFTTSNGTATAGSDFASTTGTLRIPAGSTSGSIPINVLADTQIEGDENFFVTLNSVSANARLVPTVARAQGTIVDDDTVTLRALNDTGIVLCASTAGTGLACAQTAAFPGQDAQFGRDVTNNNNADGIAGFSFTKLDTAGAPLANQAAQYNVTPWDCVRDEVTGLQWEVKTDDGGLRDRDWTYSWFNSTGVNDGGAAGTANGGVCADTSNCDTEKYVRAVNAVGMCGRNDWRMPTREELQSIVDASDTTAPVYDVAFFPNPHTAIASFHHWTSTPDARDTADAWTVSNLKGRGSAIFAKTRLFPVRLVRGGN